MAKRGNGEGNILKLSENKYMGKIMIGYKSDGKPNRVSVYGKTRKEVSDKLIKLANEVIVGTYIQPTKLTVGEWMKTWLKDYKSLNLKQRTYDTYETQINTHIIPEIGKIELKELNASQLQRFYNIKFNNDKGLSPATIRKIHSIIQAALKQACLNGLISKNASVGVVLPRLEQKKIKVFSREEEKLFFEAAKGFELYNAFLLCCDTGMRMGEVLALTYDDIDFKGETVNVNKNIMYVKDREGSTGNNYVLIVQDTPKTKASIRKIPLTQIALKMLKELKLKAEPNCNLVFPSRNNTYINPRNFERTFQTIIDKAGIEKCNTHTLRHTFATKCFEKGIQVKIVSKWLGHSKISHTLDIYTHILPDFEKQAIKMLEMPDTQEFESCVAKPNV